jgi:hypothetical protein
VSDYGLYDRAIGVQSLAGAKDYSSNLCVQIGSGAHPASCTMCTWGPFPGAERGRGVTLTTHSHLVPKWRMSRSYTPLPPSATMACSGTALLFAFLLLCIWRNSLMYKFFMRRSTVCLERQTLEWRILQEALRKQIEKKDEVTVRLTAKTSKLKAGLWMKMSGGDTVAG